MQLMSIILKTKDSYISKYLWVSLLPLMYIPSLFLNNEFDKLFDVDSPYDADRERSLIIWTALNPFIFITYSYYFPAGYYRKHDKFYLDSTYGFLIYYFLLSILIFIYSILLEEHTFRRVFVNQNSKENLIDPLLENIDSNNIGIRCL